MDIERIAELCHEVNRAVCEATGDGSQVPWQQAADAIQQSAIAGVRAVLENPMITPEALHEKWCDYKRAEGWVQGVVKDAVAKTHPCLVPYASLPVHQHIKDHTFRAIVRAAGGMP